MNLNLIHTSNKDILSQLQLEEALTKANDESWCIINEGSPKYIVMGISNKKEDLLNISRIEKDKIKIIRRFSGGGTVIIDENSIFITFIFSKKHLPFSFPNEIFKWTEEFYKNIFGLIPICCIDNDYVINNKKCCGNAQYIKKDRWLHHSCFLWDYNINNMQYLKIPQKAPSYRKNRGHKDFLHKINQYFPSKKAFINKIKELLKKDFIITDKSSEETKKFLEKNYNRSTKVI